VHGALVFFEVTPTLSSIPVQWHMMLVLKKNHDYTINLYVAELSL
jgi:hypothetical protein